MARATAGGLCRFSAMRPGARPSIVFFIFFIFIFFFFFFFFFHRIENPEGGDGRREERALPVRSAEKNLSVSRNDLRPSAGVYLIAAVYLRLHFSFPSSPLYPPLTPFSSSLLLFILIFFFLCFFLAFLFVPFSCPGSSPFRRSSHGNRVDQERESGGRRERGGR